MFSALKPTGNGAYLNEGAKERFMKKLLLISSVLCILSISAYAATERYTLDKPHTQVLFSISHLGFSNSYGRFTDYSGQIDFDRITPQDSKADVTIKTNSLQMDDSAWNERLKEDDFFNVKKFPTMTFKSTGIKVTGKNTAAMTGDLTLLGVTKPVTFDVTFNKAAPGPFDQKYVAGFSAEGHINRSDFGMTTYLPLVGDDVDIHLEVEAIRDERDVKKPMLN